MGVMADVRYVLRERLRTTPGMVADSRIQWQNREFAAIKGTPYVRETIRPFAVKRRSMGATNFRKRYSGLYLVDTFSPSLQGSSGGDALADAIVEHFWPGLQLIHSSGLVVSIESSSSLGDTQETDWRMVPVTISFYFDRIHNA